MATTSFTKKTLGLDTVEPAVTPPDAGSETTFLKKPKLTSGKSRKREIPEGIWTKCPKCTHLIYDKELDENLKVCPKCEHHFPIGSRERINFLVESTGLKDAVVTGVGKIGEHRVALGVMDFSFLGGSMGSVVGEKLARLIETGTNKGLPVIIISTSGGARMYEGMFSLMQMAKTCGALAYHAREKLPYISVLTHPTTAGVMASYASVGDLIVAEPGAMIGFAGPRVIKDTTQAELPPGFQTAEFLLDHGLIDAIIPRKEMKTRLSYYLDFMTEGRRQFAALG
jgi:acetyl-CoA carboxylase carboxyl transferase subunit beta